MHLPDDDDDDDDENPKTTHPIHPQVANQFPDCSNNTNSTGQDIPCLYI
jgi:hypothetical protein